MKALGALELRWVGRGRHLESAVGPKPCRRFRARAASEPSWGGRVPHLAKFHDAPVCMLPIIVSMRVTMALVGVKWMPVVVFLELISSAGDLSMMSLGLFAP